MLEIPVVALEDDAVREIRLPRKLDMVPCSTGCQGSSCWLLGARTSSL